MSSQIRWELLPAEPPVYCGATRGPRSRTFCEYPPGHEERFHMGRSPRGLWFSWPCKEGEVIEPLKWS